MNKNSVLTENELNKLNLLQKEYETTIKDLNLANYQKELERLAIDFGRYCRQYAPPYSLLPNPILPTFPKKLPR
ncbi:hypothetical protein [Sinomicrobium oceani]|uniref:hypothetical protein n=1 Tax=Sinomicrobium oceani TaxID=1150368 RepID=UPI00227D000C|nr:hypothetical protein [Sinomicrobium oceani]